MATQTSVGDLAASVKDRRKYHMRATKYTHGKPTQSIAKIRSHDPALRFILNYLSTGIRGRPKKERREEGKGGMQGGQKSKLSVMRSLQYFQDACCAVDTLSQQHEKVKRIKALPFSSGVARILLSVVI